jgi:hypothetical protein
MKTQGLGLVATVKLFKIQQNSPSPASSIG